MSNQRTFRQYPPAGYEVYESEADRLASNRNNRAPFCPYLREFIANSRRFHEYIYRTEAAHNPRSLPRNADRSILQRIVAYSCNYKDENVPLNEKNNYLPLNESQLKEVDRIVNEIIRVSLTTGSENIVFEVIYMTVYVYEREEEGIIPFYKVYRNNGMGNVFVTKEGNRFPSLESYFDANSLPHCLVCIPRKGANATYEVDSNINKIPLEFFALNCNKGLQLSKALEAFSSSSIGQLLESVLGGVTDSVSFVSDCVSSSSSPTAWIYRLIPLLVKTLCSYAERASSNLLISRGYAFLRGICEKIFNFLGQYISLPNLAQIIQWALRIYETMPKWGIHISRFIDSLLLNGNISATPRDLIFDQILALCDPLYAPPLRPAPSDMQTGVSSTLRQGVSDLYKLNIHLIRAFVSGKHPETRGLCQRIADIFRTLFDLFSVKYKWINSICRLRGIVYFIVDIVYFIVKNFVRHSVRPPNKIDEFMTEMEGEEILHLTGGDYSLSSFERATGKVRGKANEILIGIEEHPSFKRAGTAAGIISESIDMSLLEECVAPAEQNDAESFGDRMNHLSSLGNISVYVTEKSVCRILEEFLDCSSENAKIYVEDMYYVLVLPNRMEVKIHSVKNDDNLEMQFVFVKNNRRSIDYFAST